jgi:hypothetical protein
MQMTMDTNRELMKKMKMVDNKFLARNYYLTIKTIEL